MGEVSLHGGGEIVEYTPRLLAASFDHRQNGGDEATAMRRAMNSRKALLVILSPLMRQLPRTAEPMDTLRTAISALAVYDPNARDITRAGALRTATRLTAQFPVIVAAIERIRNGQDVVAPRPDLNIATNFLYMLKGELPPEREAHIFDVCLVLHADHELNASTFTARVVAGTLADIYNCVTAALGALSGPLHGGANTKMCRSRIP